MRGIIIGFLMVMLLFCLLNFYLYYYNTRRRCLWNLIDLNPDISVTHLILFTKGNAKQLGSGVSVQKQFIEESQKFIDNHEKSSETVLMIGKDYPIRLSSNDISQINGRLSL